jgi:hypothetical protein
MLFYKDNTASIGIDVVIDKSDGIRICRNCRYKDRAHDGYTI